MKKGILGFVLVLCVFFCLSVLPVQAASSGTCGANLTWTINNGTLTISGEGDMHDYSLSYAPWYSSRSSIKTVIIENGVTSIGYGAFYNCNSLTSVTIPDSVTKISDYAFSNCISLTRITIPDSVTSVGGRACSYCSELESITIPKSVKSIYTSAFYSCEKLKTVYYRGSSADWQNISISSENDKLINATRYYCICGDNLTWTFDEYDGILTISGTGNMSPQYWSWSNFKSSIKSVIIQDGATSIGNSAFSGCYNLTSITIPDGVTSIGSRAFESCSRITSITIPDGVTSIGDSAFSGCSKLGSITIPDSVTSIGNQAFLNCNSLTSITIPDNVTSIGSRVFLYCGSLMEINVSEGNMLYSSESGVLFNKNKTTIITCPIGKNAYTIPNSVKNIDSYAFGSCIGLTSIIIPDSVISIGDSAFYNCKSLTNITLPFVGENVNSVDKFGYIFGKSSYTGSYSANSYYIPSSLTTVKITNATQIPQGAFSGCSSLTSITIPDSITSIGDSAFSGCSKLGSITIPDSVTSIGSRAFSNCTGLSQITIPDSVTSIGNSAFSGCDSLISLNITDIASWCNINFGNSYANPLYYAQNLYLNGEIITNLIIPDGVKNIGNYMCYNCNSLTSITIPDSVTSIGNCAFNNCSNLKTVYYLGSLADWCAISMGSDNDKLTSATIHYYKGSCGYNLSWTFEDDGTLTISGTGDMDDFSSSSVPWYEWRTSIKSVIIQNGVTSIGSYAFYYCRNMTFVTIPDSMTSIGGSAFESCSRITSITIPNSVTSIGRFAFSGCSNLASITIPEGVTRIGDCAFESCSRITSITIPDGVQSINSSTFLGCSSLTSITIPDSVTSIGSSAFSGCSNLASITIPDSVVSIGNWAFGSCESLTTLNITDIDAWCNIRFNGIYANPLYYAQNLCFNGELITNLVIPNSVTSISDNAFYNCNSIKSVIIPDSVTSIGNSAFDNCNNIETVYYLGSSANWNTISIGDNNDTLTSADRYYCICGDNLTWMIDNSGTLIISGTGEMDNWSPYSYPSSYAPWYNLRSSIKTVAIQSGVTSIGAYAFYECSNITTVTIDDTVTRIGGDAFAGCTSLASITIPDSVTSIEGWAFSGCRSLTSITIPDSVTFIGDGAFDLCENLTAVNVTDIAAWCKISFSFNNGNPLYFAHNLYLNGELIKNLVIPNDVTSIGDNAFCGCTSLTSVTIPNSVTSIGNGAFSGCNNLLEMAIPFVGRCRNASDMERTFGYIFGMFMGDGSYEVWQNYSPRGSMMFSLPKSLKKVTVTNETSVPYGAFNNCTNIYEIDIKEGPSAIENYAFSGCDLLKKVSVPSSVETIAQYAFSNSSNIIIYGNENAYIAAFATRNKIPFVKTDSTGGEEGNITLVTEDSVGDLTWKLYSNGLFELSGSGDMPTFRNNTKTPWYSYIDTVKKITIGADTDITSYAFFGMDNLEYVNIIGNVTEIADDAFSSCANLSKIIIPSSVSVIGEYAFDDCPKLTIYCKSGSAAETFATENGIATKVSGFDAVLNKIGEHIIVTANVPDDDITKNIHAALYSDNGAMLDYMIYPAEYSNNTVHFMFRNMLDLSYIKVFLWNGFETMMPLDDSIMLNVGE